MSKDKIYTAIDLYDGRGMRGQLRVVAVEWKDEYRAHIREYYTNERGGFSPGRGTSFKLEELDRIIYALNLMKQDYIDGKLEGKNVEKSENENSKEPNEESKLLR